MIHSTYPTAAKWFEFKWAVGEFTPLKMKGDEGGRWGWATPNSKCLGFAMGGVKAFPIQMQWFFIQVCNTTIYNPYNPIKSVLMHQWHPCHSCCMCKGSGLMKSQQPSSRYVGGNWNICSLVVKVPSTNLHQSTFRCHHRSLFSFVFSYFNQQNCPWSTKFHAFQPKAENEEGSLKTQVMSHESILRSLKPHST